MIKPRFWETAKEYMLRVVPIGDKCSGNPDCQYYVDEKCKKWNVCIIDGLKCGYCRGAVVHPKPKED